MQSLKTVQSVTGPVGPDELGLTLPHEHVFINMSPTEPRDGYMTVWEERVADIERFVAAGGRTLFDVTNAELSDYAAPVYFDRDPAHQVKNPVTGSRSVANVLATKAMAEETGVNVILGTGHYFDHYFDVDWFERNSTEQIAEYLIADLEHEIPGTGVRAGFVGEVASDLPYITAREERSFRASGRAAARTGVMVTTHAPSFPTGETQIDILTQEGVEPERIVIGHTDTVKNPQYSIDLLKRGVYVEYDCMMAVKSGGHVADHELDRRVTYLRDLIELGYADRLLLSQDVSQRSHQAALGGPGLTFIFDEFAAAATAAGIEPEVLNRISTENPRRVLFWLLMALIANLDEAVDALVADGDSVALEGFTHLIPFAAGHEIIRQGRRDLTLIRMTPDLLYDQMIGMGTARRLVFSYGGNPGVGSLHRFRDAVENGWPAPLSLEEHSHAGMANRYAAGAARLPFAVMRGYLGTDLLERTRVEPITCPFSGEELVAVPALNPDVAIVHAQEADRDGNVQLWGIPGVQKEAVLAAARSLVTVERIVERLEQRPGALRIPGWAIDFVAAAPGGSQPSYSLGITTRDNDFYVEWDRLSRDRDEFRAWMEEHLMHGAAAG